VTGASGHNNNTLQHQQAASQQKGEESDTPTSNQASETFATMSGIKKYEITEVCGLTFLGGGVGGVLGRPSPAEVMQPHLEHRDT
jgi:hypothetical protein